MTILILACSKAGFEIGKLIDKKRKEDYKDDEIELAVKSQDLPEISIKESMSSYVKKYFDKVDAIVVIGATGIAVRLIAGCIGHKSKDPAVIVIDSTAKFCISLLSGHAGGANELTEYFSEITGAQPVITTATDRMGKFAVDEFARKNNLIVTDWEKAKKIAVKALNDEEIIIKMEHDNEKSVADVIISPYLTVNKDSLRLVPQCIYLGIGCKKDTEIARIEEALDKALSETNVDRRAIKSVASIDLKKDEAGLVDFCTKNGWSFETFSSEELLKVEGEFSASEFVAKITGVDNVCERAAIKASEGKLILKKMALNGVTIAMAVKMEEIRFE